MEETPKIDNQKALFLVASFGTKKFYHLVQSTNHFGPKFLSTKQVSWVRSLLSLLGQEKFCKRKLLPVVFHFRPQTPE